jgi:hypothetical protein
MKKRETSRTAIQTRKRRAITDGLHQTQGMADGDGDLEVP